MNNIRVNWAGLVDYDQAWEWQKQKTSMPPFQADFQDELLLLEHPPTFTLGRSGSLDHLLLSETAAAEGGFTVRWVDRGGDITYHGPGQLVGYPLLDLKRLFANRGQKRPDLHRYLRDVEEVIILALQSFAIAAWRYEGYTGVWVDGPSGPEKIAAIGLKVNGRGLSSHGFALNVNPNMDHFDYIIPCGIREHGVTSMTRLLPRSATVADLITPIINAFAQVFQMTPVIPKTVEKP